MPTGKRCIRSRTLRFKLKRPSGTPLTGADVYIGTKRIHRLTGAALRKTVVLRNLPRSRFTVIVVVSLRDGGRLKGRRTLRVAVSQTPAGVGIPPFPGCNVTVVV